MSNSVDNRIVEMNFNNAQFEKGVSTSVNSIDTLKKSLNFNESIKSSKTLSDSLSKDLSNISFNKLASGIDSISSKFSLLGISAVTAIQNITNSLINMAKTAISALTIDPVKTGFNLYETMINATQTVYANTMAAGSTLDDVNASLLRLNDYSAKTIYNFGDMARNLGTFTAAGVGLKDAESAIKGIANLAALSGVNNEKAAGAMYQLSQALAAGTVRAMDWNSVVQAGMGGTAFQKALIDAARVHGVSIDRILKQEGGFRQSLEKGWLKSSILAEALTKFTGDLTDAELKNMGYTDKQIAEIQKMAAMAVSSATEVRTATQLWQVLTEAAQQGWGTTWTILVGNLEDAKKLYTEISNVVGGILNNSAASRNELLQAWKDMGGRDLAIKSLLESFQSLLKILKPITDAFREFFPKTTAIQLFLISVYLQRFSSALSKLSHDGKTLEKIKNTFRGFFAVLDIGRMLVSAFIKMVGNLLSRLKGTGASFLDSTSKLGLWLVNLRDAIKTGDKFNVAFAKIGENIAKAFAKISLAVQYAANKIKAFYKMFTEKTKNLGKGFDISGAVTSLNGYLEKLKEALPNMSGLIKVVQSGLKFFQGMFNKVAPIFSAMATKIKTFIGKLVDNFFGALATMDSKRAFEILNAGLFAGILLAIRTFISKGGNVFTSIIDVFKGVKGAISTLGGVAGILSSVRDTLVTYQNNIKADTLLKIAGALAIMTISLIALSMLDPIKLAFALGTVTLMLAELFTAMQAFEKNAGGIGSSISMSVGITAIALSLILFAGAIAILSKMKPEEIMNGMMAITGFILIISATSKTLAGSSENLVKGSIGLAAFSLALRLMVGPVKSLGELEYTTLQNGLMAVGAILIGLAAFMRVTDMSKMSVKSALGIVLLAGAINVIVLAVKTLGSMDPDQMNQGLMSVGAIMLALMGFIQLTSGSTGTSLAGLGVGVLLIAGALMILTQVVSVFADMSWEELGRGLAGMAGALTLITIAMNALPKDMLLTSVGLLLVAGALYIMANAMSSFGQMSWEQIGRSLVMLAGSLLIIGVALQFMTTALPGAFAMIIIAGALAIMTPALVALGNMSWEAIAKGIVMLAAVFTVLGLAAYVLTPMIPSLLGLGAALLLLGIAAVATGAGVLLLSMGLAALAVTGGAGAAALISILLSLASILPIIAMQIAKAFVTFISTLASSAPGLVTGLATLIGTLVDAVAMNIPKIVDAIVILVGELIDAIITLVPKIIEAAWTLLQALYQGAADHVQDIVELGVTIVTNIINGFSNSLPAIIDAGWNLILNFINGMKDGIQDHMADLIVALTELGVAMIEGLVLGVQQSDAIIKQAIIDIGNIILDTIKEMLGIASPSTEFFAIATDMIQGMIDGINNMIESIKLTVTTFIQNIIDTFTAKVTEFYTIGSDYIAQIKQSIIDTASTVITEVVTLITSIIKTFTDKAIEIYNTGRDIVTGIANGIKDYVWMAINEASKLGQAIIDKILSLFDESSPSKVFYEIGAYAVEGLANGIKQTTSLAVSSVTNLANETITGLADAASAANDFLNSAVDMSPTIRPVLDLTDIENQSKMIADYIDTSGFSVPVSATTTAANVSNTMAQTTQPAPQPIPQNGSQISFTQNNYSPKALSRFEIYRQTRNQLRLLQQLKG